MRFTLCSIADSDCIDLRGTKLRRFNLFAVAALCALFNFAAVSTASGVEVERPKRVLIISTGSRLAPGFMIVDQQLLQALGSIPSVRTEIYAENLDLIRFPNDRYGQIFSEYLTAKYAAHPPDLVILVFVGTLGIPGKLLPELFPRTPIVVAGFTEEEIRADQFGTLVSGVAQRVNPRATLELIFRLQPELRRVVIIGGTAEIDRQVLRRVKEAAQSIKGHLQIDFWDNLTMAELRKAVIAVPQDTAILYARMFRDAAGQAVISSEVGQWIAQSANVPVYVMTDASFGTGAVGGSLASIEAFGKRAGELARLILTGIAPASLPFEIRSDSVATFDWRALKRWGISESRLPPGSMVRFKPRSMWEQYYWYIIGALIIIAMQTAIIADLLLQRARRRRAEAGLLESQQFMKLATEAGGIGLWVRDLVRGDLWVNPRLRSLLGFGQADVLGVEDILARVHPDDRAQVMSVVERAQETAIPFDLEFRTAIPDTPERWIAVRGRFMRGPQGQLLRRVGTMIDITGRKLAEQKLWESEKNFRRLVENTSGVIWEANIDTWVFSYVGPQAVKLLGYPLEQWFEKDFWISHIHPDDRERAVNTCLTMSKSAQEFDFEYRMIGASGAVVWIHDTVNCQHHNGKPRQLRGLMLDITERKQAEETLRGERAFLRQVIDTVPNFIFAKDRQGRFTLANQAIAVAYGTTVENLIGKTDADFNPHRDEVEFFRRIDAEVIETLQELAIPEEQITDAQGRVRWLQTVKRPIIERDGSAKQLLGASTDITKRKETETELREQRAELAHMARITTMGELAASLAHELNQPLTAILSNAQAALRFLSSRPADIEEVREILQDIVKDNNRAGEIIRRMRALVKKEQTEFESLDLAHLIRDVVTLVHSDTVLHNVKIELKLDGNLPTVRGDKVQLQQVVLNLLLNAFDAMNDDSVGGEREVNLMLQRNGMDLVQASVRDCGTGLSGDKLDKIFQPFYTTKGEGLGMGLSICRSIIEAHGGRLWAENNADHGATFYFTVPVERGVRQEFSVNSEQTSVNSDS
jgi:two-component system, LuxR family, sensor kinase FixL